MMILHTLVCVTSLAAVAAQLVGPGDLTARLDAPGGPVEDAPPPPAATGDAPATPTPPPPVPPPADDTPDADDPGDPPQAAFAIAPEDAPPEEAPLVAAPPDGVNLTQTSLPILPEATLVPVCGCANRRRKFEPRIDDIRKLSNQFLKSKNTKSPIYTNMVWSWGQFLDHDFVASSDDPDDKKNFPIDVEGTVMNLMRVRHVFQGKCRRPQSTLTPQIDAGPIYSNFEPYIQGTLRKPGTCMLRESAGRLPPVTTDPVATKDEGGNDVTKHFFLAGDSRVDEHAILTNMHTIWLREHNRLCDVIDSDEQYADLDSDDKFQLVRDVIVAKMQEITLFEWLPALGVAPEDVYYWRPRFRVRNTAAISTEFFLTYRWGHLGVPITVGEWNIMDIFDGEEFMDVEGPEGSASPDPTNEKLERLLSATAQEAMSDLDGRMEESLRSNLFVPGMDLGSRNIFRGREVGIVGYKRLAFCFRSFPDFSIRGHNDPFIGATAERPEYPGQAFGPTLHNIMLDQFHRVLFGRQGNWWEFSADKVRGFEDEIIGTKLSDIIRANTKADVQDDVFIQPGKTKAPTLQKRFNKFAGGRFSKKFGKKFGKGKPSDPNFRPKK